MLLVLPWVLLGFRPIRWLVVVVRDKECQRSGRVRPRVVGDVSSQSTKSFSFSSSGCWFVSLVAWLLVRLGWLVVGCLALHRRMLCIVVWYRMGWYGMNGMVSKWDRLEWDRLVLSRDSRNGDPQSPCNILTVSCGDGVCACVSTRGFWLASTRGGGDTSLKYIIVF